MDTKEKFDYQLIIKIKDDFVSFRGTTTLPVHLIINQCISKLDGSFKPADIHSFYYQPTNDVNDVTKEKS